MLFGTGSPAHLRTNIEFAVKPPLPEADHRKLGELFGHLVGVGLDAPHLSSPRETRIRQNAREACGITTRDRDRARSRAAMPISRRRPDEVMSAASAVPHPASSRAETR